MSSETTPTATTTTENVVSPIVTDGAQPVVTSPVVEPTVPVPDPVPDPAPSATTTTTDNQPKPTPEWAQKRINELTASRHAAERAAASEKSARLAAEARATELLSQIANKDPNAPAPAATSNLSEEEVERRAKEKAIQIAQQNEFNKACNDIAETGKEKFKDWDDALKNLTLVGAIGKDVSPDFLETAIELKNPASILHHLGMNLEEAERVAKLPPKKMAMEMARIEAKLNAPAPAPVIPPVSNAPAPVIPVGGAAKPGAPSIDDPNLSGEEWMALRSKQVEERRNRYKRA